MKKQLKKYERYEIEKKYMMGIKYMTMIREPARKLCGMEKDIIKKRF